jgi:hypothetical protein
MKSYAGQLRPSLSLWPLKQFWCHLFNKYDFLSTIFIYSLDTTRISVLGCMSVIPL